MIYTIGNKKSYDQALAEEAQPLKLGKQEPCAEFPDGYPGGIVFPSRELAQAFIDNGCMESRLGFKPGITWEVYGMQVTWELGTYVTPSGEHALLNNTPFVSLRSR